MLSRRQLLSRTGAATAAVVLAPQSAVELLAAPRAQAARLMRGGRFRQGVLSGDPTESGITLLTLLDEVEGSGDVRLEVARDPEFRRVVARQRIGTGARRSHSVKARVTGLDAHERYWYRFETRDEQSPVGRFQTALPEDSDQPVRFAFFSCADYSHGYYNAYELMRRDDIDFVVCLGDYVYAETYHGRETGTSVREDRIGTENPRNAGIVREARSIGEYRSKYALYRSDASLRALHARVPMVATWDDHEVQDNYAGEAPNGGLAESKRYSARRRRAGEQAWEEAMPFFRHSSGRVWRGGRQGRTVDLIMLDQRQHRDDQPCNDAVAPPCAEWQGPRAFLGEPQLGWLKQRLSRSDATWKVIGSQTLMMPAKVTGGAFYGFDSWHGYPDEREDLLEHIRSDAIKDVVFLTGDIHTFIAGDVRTRMGEGETVALEFVGGSVTSTNFGETDLELGGGLRLEGNDADPSTDPTIIGALRGINPWVDQADFDHHGYGLVTATSNAFDVTLERVETIKQRSRRTLPRDGYRYEVARGQRSIKGVNGPPA